MGAWENMKMGKGTDREKELGSPNSHFPIFPFPHCPISPISHFFKFPSFTVSHVPISPFSRFPICPFSRSSTGADTVKSTREGFERVQGIFGRYLGESFPFRKSKEKLRKTRKTKESLDFPIFS